MEIETFPQLSPHRVLQSEETSLVVLKATEPLFSLFLRHPLEHCTAFRINYIRSSLGSFTYPAGSSSLLVESHELVSKTKGCWSCIQGEPRALIGAFAADTNFLQNREQPWFTFKEPTPIHRFSLELKTETGDLIFGIGEIITIVFEFKHNIALGLQWN